ncbi:MAG: hypothetical protein ABIP39_14885, partial [Polyangiaceae bacterium]
MLGIVALISLPFIVQHVREGIYPALVNPDAVVGAAGSGDALGPMGGEGRGGARAKGEAPAGAAVAVVPQSPPELQAPAPAQMNAMDEDKPAEANDVARKAPAKADEWQRQAVGGKHGSLGSLDYRQSNAQVYDPAAIVQTGPGLPRWTWTTLDLRWSGPVAATQRIHLYLLSPRMNLFLAFLRAALLVIMILRLFPWTQRFFPRGWAAPAAVLAGLALVLVPSIAQAQTPSPEMLQELQNRLLRKPDCSPSCASSSRMVIEVRGGSLRARMEVDASAPTAVPLPGNGTQWTPSEVLLDGQPAKGLVRLDDVLWIELTAGAHQIALGGLMPDRESMQLALHLKPHRVEAASEGWTVEGLHEDGLADDNLQFTRIRSVQDGGAGASLQPGALPPFVRVERTLQIGLNWQVDTRVVRVTPPGTAVVLEVPLLPGESVTTADVRVVSGKALVNMSPLATEVSWHSALEQKSPVKLVAPKSLSWVEVWRVDVGPIWHSSYSGIPFVHTQPVAGMRMPEWRPWPGEEASVELVRPDGVPGQTLTIDESTTALVPGIRATDVTLTLSVRSSRGAQHTLTLPPDAQLESLTINGTSQPLRQEGRKVMVPIVPGAQSVVLVWRETPGISFLYNGSAIDLGAPSVNATTTIQVPGGRWMLLAGGPRVGPAVLFWSLLLALVVVSLGLGRNTWTPLRSWHWLLLTIGLSQVNVIAGAIFVGWLMALGWRARDDGESLGVVTFNLRQLVLIGWTIVALCILGASIYQGLLGAPEMQVRGNGSSSDFLRWFTDRSEPTLPTPWMISVPILIYRAVMLAWALWIALALLRWLRWGWDAFSTGGGWKKSPPRVVRPIVANYNQYAQPAYPQGYPQQQQPQPQYPQAQEQPPPAPVVDDSPTIVPPTQLMPKDPDEKK